MGMHRLVPSGRRVLPGSYMVEVIADSTELLLRKRVVVP